MKQQVSTYVTILYKHFNAFCNERLSRVGLSQGLLYFVLYIGKHPGCSPGQLSTSLHFDTGHTTRSIDKLVQTGFVTREKSTEDKRAYVLKLTDQGQEAFRISHDVFKEWDNEVLSSLDETEIQELMRIFQKMNIRKEFLL